MTEAIERKAGRGGGDVFERAKRWLWLFCRWWLTEAKAIVPSRAAGWMFGGDQHKITVALAAADNEVEIRVSTRSGKTLHSSRMRRSENSLREAFAAASRAGVDVNKMPVGIAMQAGSIYERVIEVPREALPDLEAIARQEMVRRTPFKPDLVYMDMSVSAHPTDRAKRVVRQRIVRRDLVADQCLKLDIDPERIGFVEAPNSGGVDVVALTSGQKKRQSRWGIVVIALALGGLCLGVVDIGIVWWRQQSALDALEAQLPATRAKALDVRKMLDDIKRAQTAVQSMFDRTAAPRMLQIWDEVSRKLPDSSWLTEFSIDDGQLSIAGYSDNAATLIPLFHDSELLAEVALSSPIVTQGNMPLERFAIRARIARGPDNDGAEQ